MDIQKVGKIPASRVSMAACVLGTSTILLCYFLAVYLGHVPAWFPMISDCAVYAPEKYPFRIGMILSAALVFANAVLYYFYIDSKITRTYKVAVVVAGIASCGLATLGAVNEQEDNPVHSGAAIVFFFGYEAFMIISCVRLARVPSYSKMSICFKRIIAFVAAILLALFVYFSSHWGKYHIEIALCEWSAVLLILIYNGSMSWEFKEEFVGELLFAVPSLPTTSTSTTPSTSTSTKLPCLSSPSSSPSLPFVYSNDFAPYYPHPAHQMQHMMYVPLPMVAEYRDNNNNN